MDEDLEWTRSQVDLQRSVLTGFVSAFGALSKHGEISRYWVRNLDLHLFTIHNCLRQLDDAKAELEHYTEV